MLTTPLLPNQCTSHNRKLHTAVLLGIKTTLLLQHRWGQVTQLLSMMCFVPYEGLWSSCTFSSNELQGSSTTMLSMIGIIEYNGNPSVKHWSVSSEASNYSGVKRAFNWREFCTSRTEELDWMSSTGTIKFFFFLPNWTVVCGFLLYHVDFYQKHWIRIVGESNNFWIHLTKFPVWERPWDLLWIWLCSASRHSPLLRPFQPKMVLIFLLPVWLYCLIACS